MLDQKIKKHMKVIMKNVCVKLQWKTYKKQKHFFLNTGIADLDKWEKTYFKNWSMHSPLLNLKKFAENNYILRKCKIRCKNGHSHTDGRVWRNAPVKILGIRNYNEDESNTGKLQIYKTAGRISTTVNRTLLVFYLPSED